MATIIFDNFRNAQMGTPAAPTTTVDFDADTIHAHLLEGVGGDGVTHVVTFDSYDDVDGTAGAAEVAVASDSSEVPLTTKTIGVVSVGTFDADSITYGSISNANDADYLTLYKFDATPANATLVASWDSATTGLPVTPNGGDITVTWNASGIVRI